MVFFRETNDKKNVESPIKDMKFWLKMAKTEPRHVSCGFAQLPLLAELVFELPFKYKRYKPISIETKRSKPFSQAKLIKPHHSPGT